MLRTLLLKTVSDNKRKGERMMESNKELNKEPKKTGNKKLIVTTAAIVAAMCIVAAVVILSVGSGTEKRLAEQLDLAERYLSELDYESAIAAYEAALEIDPKCEEAYLGLADIYMEQGEYEKAVEILEAGLAHIDSENIRSKLEEIEELLAEREKAAEEFLTVEEETPVEEEVPAEEAAGRVPYADEMAAIANASVGDIVYLGSYEQDNNLGNGTEPVEWYVLDKADGEATLLAVYLLDCQPYHEVLEDITWEDCTLRNWLNDTFYNTTFSEEEQAAVVNTNVVNEDNPFFGTEGGLRSKASVVIGCAAANLKNNGRLDGKAETVAPANIYNLCEGLHLQNVQAVIRIVTKADGIVSS